jgi:CBS domain-containing protein
MSGLTVADVMTYGAVSAVVGTPYRDLVDLLEMRSVNAVPIIDSFDRVLGVVSASDLLHKIEFAGGVDPPRIFESRQHRRDRRKAAGLVAEQLMTSPAVTVSKRTSVAEAARVMEATGVRRLPVIDDLGRLIGMVTNRDLLKVFLRPDDHIKRQVVVDILSRVDGGAASVVSVEAHEGAVLLTGELERRTSVEALTASVEAVEGVVSVDNQIEWRVDDVTPTISVAMA